jgi:hypothetical protein
MALKEVTSRPYSAASRAMEVEYDMSSYGELVQEAMRATLSYWLSQLSFY